MRVCFWFPRALTYEAILAQAVMHTFYQAFHSGLQA